MKNRKALLVYRLAIAVFLLACGMHLFWKGHRLAGEGVTAPGVIVSEKQGKTPARYRFTAQGRWYWGSFDANRSVGENVEVRYLPSDPSVNQGVGDSSIDPTWVFIGCGLALAAVSVPFYLKRPR